MPLLASFHRLAPRCEPPNFVRASRASRRLRRLQLQVELVFDEPTQISFIKFWNYSRPKPFEALVTDLRTPGRGVRDLEIYVSRVLLLVLLFLGRRSADLPRNSATGTESFSSYELIADFFYFFWRRLDQSPPMKEAG